MAFFMFMEVKSTPAPCLGRTMACYFSSPLLITEAWFQNRAEQAELVVDRI